MNNSKIYASDLSSSRHVFSKYHFCRGNSNKRKTTKKIYHPSFCFDIDTCSADFGFSSSLFSTLLIWFII